MHRLIEAAGRRTAGLAAGVVLTGGLVGGVLLTPGTAYASTATIAITSATANSGGITVDVAVTNGSDPLGTFSVAGAGSGCTGSLFGFPGSGNGNGRCTIGSVGAGTYTLTASYDGQTSAGDTVTVSNPTPTPPPPTTTGNAPVFSADSPPTSVDGNSYSYQFAANNSASFELSGAPSWLSIDSTGMVSGNIPDSVNSFTFSVKAWNNWGFVWAGPFTVFFHHHHHNNFVNLSTSLTCTSPVYTGQHGTCTLYVTNSGSGSASDVTASIALPWQLRADYCGYYYWFGYGCSISGNTASEDLGTLYQGQTKHLTVTFTAETGFSIFGRHHGRQFYVKVTGSASAAGNFYGYYGYYGYYGQRTSYATAYVHIIPRGFWW
jgi:hypothetical protein